MYNDLKKYIVKNLKNILIYIVLFLILWSSEILLPYISGVYIDMLVIGIVYEDIIKFLIILAFINFAKLIGQYFKTLIGTNLNNTIAYQISNDIFQKIFKTQYLYYSSIDSAYLIDQINKDTNIVVRFFTGNIVSFALQVLTIIISGNIIYRTDKYLCLLIFAIIPIYAATFYLNKHNMYSAHLRHKKNSNEYFSTYNEQLSKLLYVKRNVLFGEMQERLTNSYKILLHSVLKSTKIDYIFTNLNQIVILIVYLCIVGLGGYKVSIGKISIGSFSIINTYFNMIIRSISYFLGLASAFQDASVSYNRICAIMGKK